MCAEGGTGVSLPKGVEFIGVEPVILRGNARRVQRERFALFDPFSGGETALSDQEARCLRAVFDVRALTPRAFFRLLCGYTVLGALRAMDLYGAVAREASGDPHFYAVEDSVLSERWVLALPEGEEPADRLRMCREAARSARTPEQAALQNRIADLLQAIA